MFRQLFACETKSPDRGYVGLKNRSVMILPVHLCSWACRQLIGNRHRCTVLTETLVVNVRLQQEFFRQMWRHSVSLTMKLSVYGVVLAAVSVCPLIICLYSLKFMMKNQEGDRSIIKMPTRSSQTVWCWSLFFFLLLPGNACCVTKRSHPQRWWLHLLAPPHAEAWLNSCVGLCWFCVWLKSTSTTLPYLLKSSLMLRRVCW